MADAEPQRDDLVRVPARDEREDLALALGQLDDRVAVAAGGQQLARRARVQRRVAGGRGANGAQQLVGLGVLEQVAHGARLERLEDPRPVAERRQHDDPRRGVLGDDPPGRRGAVEVGHLEVDEDDVGPVLAGERDALLAAAARPRRRARRRRLRAARPSRLAAPDGRRR